MYCIHTEICTALRWTPHHAKCRCGAKRTSNDRESLLPGILCAILFATVSHSIREGASPQQKVCLNFLVTMDAETTNTTLYRIVFEFEALCARWQPGQGKSKASNTVFSYRLYDFDGHSFVCCLCCAQENRRRLNAKEMRLMFIRNIVACGPISLSIMVFSMM